jgi:hypothetical protein
MRIVGTPYAQTSLGVRSLVNIGRELNWPPLEARVDWCEKNRVAETPMGFDLNQFATRYRAAWCSQHAAGVAAFFAEGGSLKINDGAPAIGRAAKENGIVAYLPTARIRIYNRVAFQRELAAFNKRYTDSIGNLEMGAVSPAPELTEYLDIVAVLIKQNDLEMARIGLFDKESRAILDGVQDEETLLKVIGLKKTRPKRVRSVLCLNRAHSFY